MENPPLKRGFDFIGNSVVCFCHDGTGKFVMIKRSENAYDEKGRWDFPAGGIDFVDTVEQTIRKEVQEEICATVISFEFLGYRDVHRQDQARSTHWIALDFSVLIDPTHVIIGEPHKCDGLQWCTLNTLPNPRHSQSDLFFETYKERLSKFGKNI